MKALTLAGIPSAIGGSAVAGFGLSLGRDVYKKAKQNIGSILLIAAIVLSIFGLFVAGIWFFRNYRTTIKMIIFRFLSVITALFSCVFLLSLVYIFKSNPSVIEPLQGIFVIASGPTGAIFVGIFLVGGLLGFSQRGKRKRIWSAEESNSTFLSEVGLDFDKESGHAFDKSGNKYRIEGISENRVVLFAVGRKNKRGFITIDKDGRYLDWSGLVSI